MVDSGMAFVDNWVVGKEKGCYWLSNDVVEMLEAYKNKMPKSSPNMHVNQELSTRVKPRLLCKQSMGKNTPNKINDDGSKSHQG